MTEWVGLGVGTLTDGVGTVTAWVGNAVSGIGTLTTWGSMLTDGVGQVQLQMPHFLLLLAQWWFHFP